MTALADAIRSAPLVHSARDAAIGWERLRARLAEIGPSEAATLAPQLLKPKVRSLIDGIFGASPFLTRMIVRRPDILAAALAAEPDAMLLSLLEKTRALGLAALPRAPMMSALRQAKEAAALIIALADLAGVWPLERVTAALTDFADAALNAALDHLLLSAAARNQIELIDSDEPQKGSGLMLLAMGKYGAHELNYSSDIDIIVFYERGQLRAMDGHEIQPLLIRLVQDLVRLLQDRTEDGYVFRVDLRLRPDGNASPVAISTEAAELYYEGSGQNWERAAMIKARLAAGDRVAGAAFLKSLVPFIWRRHLDFAAIEDIHSIKRQIHAVKGHGRIAVRGHNLKLGRGGIREIEFFAQTQQLILGGRDPTLRVRGTCEALARLADRGMVKREVEAELAFTYTFLRTIEHRLQMINDEQTHTLPKRAEELEAVARFSGFESFAPFEARLSAELVRVQGHYAALFEESPSLAAEEGSLVFTGVEEDPETVSTLTNMGFARAAEISATVRGWHHGRIRATRSARARELLTRLVPPLLAALAKTREADEAFIRFSRFLEGLPAGVQIFSLLLSNAWLLDLLADVFSIAPRLARVLAEAPGTLDALLDPDYLVRPLTEEEIETDIVRLIPDGLPLEAKLDAARIFARERQFRVSLQLIRGTIGAAQAGRAFAALARAVIARMAREAEAEIARKHGRIEAGDWAVIGLGKLGGDELSATSDLDLIFVYEFDEARSASGGPAPIHASQYYAKLGQRLISLLTVPTSEGRLYDVDMRLRPSGGAGPVAVTRQRFKSYHETEAWVFERMSLTRARIIHASGGFGSEIKADIERLLRSPRDPESLRADAAAMRRRLDETKRETDPWHLKHVRGGLVDLEYIVQLLQLLAAPSGAPVLNPNTEEAIAALARAGRLEAAEAEALGAAARLLHGLSQVLRISLGEERNPEGAGPSLADVVFRLTGAKTFPGAEARLIAAEAAIHRLHLKYVGGAPS